MAWTVTSSFDGSEDLGSGETLYKFKFVCTSDGSASGDVVLSQQLDTDLGTKWKNFYMARIRGGLLYGVEYQPGSATPTTNPVVTVDNEDGTIILSRTFTTNVPDFEPGTNQTGMYVPVKDLIFASGTLDNAKTATFKLIISK